MELPPSFTQQVLGLLARAGIAETKAGRGGGYRLARSPRRIAMLEVVEAAEGPLANERCTLRGGPCRWDDHCAVHETWTRAREALRAQLSRTSLAAVAAEDRRIAGR
jgi:Rrf2 family protein